jgi:protein-S-isoprenylcysteine O-methyltransferase Ste14
LWGVAQFLPLIYIFSDWLNFANYELPQWAGWIGVVIFTPGVWLLWRSHVDLGRNWSATLEIRSGHTLITGGVYRWLRHPMYAAHLYWAMGQPLLIQNWIAGPLALVSIVPMYLLRAPQEEKMMLDEFGDEYRAYMARTGGIVPKLRRRSAA